jgi:hypothetical protein
VLRLGGVPDVASSTDHSSVGAVVAYPSPVLHFPLLKRSRA